MKLKLYQVDTFTDQLFSGNPAAVVPLEKWLQEELMQKIALENNLSETAFFIPGEPAFELRWFTPTVEMNLCGHATLASAHVLLRHLQHPPEEIHFHTKSGLLKVKSKGDYLTLDLPADTLSEVEAPAIMREILRVAPKQTYRGKENYLVLLSSQDEVKNLSPDFQLMTQLDGNGIIVTAVGDDVDFVSRFFAPNIGIPEDPVTGAAHTSLIPLWSETLGKNELTARQLSERGGYLECKLVGDRVEMSGKAVTYLEGIINV